VNSPTGVKLMNPSSLEMIEVFVNRHKGGRRAHLTGADIFDGPLPADPNREVAVLRNTGIEISDLDRTQIFWQAQQFLRQGVQAVRIIDGRIGHHIHIIDAQMLQGDVLVAAHLLPDGIGDGEEASDEIRPVPTIAFLINFEIADRYRTTVIHLDLGGPGHGGIIGLAFGQGNRQGTVHRQGVGSFWFGHQEQRRS
jgi:hypothetical protein